MKEGPLADAERRCLVVDDESHLRMALARLMRSEGYECREAANGRDALAILAGWPAAVVLSDLDMPVLDGMGLLRQLQLTAPTTAVVMITAVADVSAAVQCLSLGALDYLTKPFHVDEVRARVRQAMQRRRLVLENLGYQKGLERRVAEQASRIEHLFLSGIQALVDTLEVKDAYTLGHSLRVSRHSVVVARVLDLDDELVEQIELGGRVHDLGKVGVREAVLNKPGPLTDEEYQHIMTHPMVGWRILQPLLQDRPHALHVVRSHHERFDGAGLPDGIAGADIPLAARVTMVADTFDAMTSARPYRPGLPPERAITEIRRCRDSQFDPVCADAFIYAFESGLLRPHEAVPG